MESVIFPQVSYFSLTINWRKNTVSHLLFCSISVGYIANFSDFCFSSSLVFLAIQCIQVIILAAKDPLKERFAINVHMHKFIGQEKEYWWKAFHPYIININPWQALQ